MVDLISIFNDPDIRNLAIYKLTAALASSEAQTAEIKKALEQLNSNSQALAASTKPRQAKKGVGPVPGSKGHREAITAAVFAKPGMTVREIREFLANAKHDINPKVLSTLLHVMSKEWTASKGEKGLRTEGTRGFTTYWTK